MMSEGRPRVSDHTTSAFDVGSGLADALAAELDARLADADRALAAGYPGDAPGRQPVHTVYVPADQFRADLVPSWGARALSALHAHPDLFSEVAGGPEIAA